METDSPPTILPEVIRHLGERHIVNALVHYRLVPACRICARFSGSSGGPDRGFQTPFGWYESTLGRLSSKRNLDRSTPGQTIISGKYDRFRRLCANDLSAEGSQ